MHQRPERMTPVPNGLAGDRDAALGNRPSTSQKLKTRAVVEPDGVPDDRGRELCQPRPQLDNASVGACAQQRRVVAMVWKNEAELWDTLNSGAFSESVAWFGFSLAHGGVL